jgi:hypothetical protein
LVGNGNAHPSIAERETRVCVLKHCKARNVARILSLRASLRERASVRSVNKEATATLLYPQPPAPRCAPLSLHYAWRVLSGSSRSHAESAVAESEQLQTLRAANLTIAFKAAAARSAALNCRHRLATPQTENSISG